jgi:SAM-dependent methyltransferase
MSVAEAYNAVAPQYDDLLSHDQWMRSFLWARYRQLFQPQQSVLDLGCGTGLDSLFLAQLGVNVTAVDISPGMIERLQMKVAHNHVVGSIATAVLDMTDKAMWPNRSFDGLIAVFAVLNTFPDLAQFATLAAAHLRPQGRMLLHILNGRSLQEWRQHLLHGRWRQAKQLGQQQVRHFQLNEQAVLHYLYPPQTLYDSYFAPDFVLRQSYGLGVFHPPQLQSALFSNSLVWLERWLGGKRPFTHWGRFFVLELEKR